jgi:hypothetical protein
VPANVGGNLQDAQASGHVQKDSSSMRRTKEAEIPKDPGPSMARDGQDRAHALG